MNDKVYLSVAPFIHVNEDIVLVFVAHGVPSGTCGKKKVVVDCMLLLAPTIFGNDVQL